MPAKGRTRILDFLPSLAGIAAAAASREAPR
jgi:hypothetical protein